MQTEQRARVTQRVTLVGAAVNCVLASLQILFGILGKSQALLADGIHTLSDLSTDIIVYYASHRAARAADEAHPYGHGRIETLASMLLGGILALVGIGIGIRGVESMFEPAQPRPEVITVFFAFLAIVAKEGLYRYTIRAARSSHSTLLESNAWHHRSDALSSVIVVIGISGQLLGLPHMDAGAAVIVGAMILLIGFRLGRNALSELIDTALDLDMVDDLRLSMQADNSVVGVHNLRTRTMGGMGYVDVHIEVDSDLTVSEAHYIAHKIEHRVKTQFPKIIDVQIHIDPLDNKVKEAVLARLPGRGVIEADLQKAWQNIAGHEKISQVKLHYLDERVEIDLVLPLSMSQPQYAEAIEKMRGLGLELDYVGKINIFYN